jgi:hypothetical protein
VVLLRGVPILFALACGAAAQPAPKKISFEGRPAVALANDKLSLTILLDGGAFAEIVLADDPERLNPLWNPARLAREGAQAFDPASTGHFVCVDGFGPVSAEERAAGLPNHGEARTRPHEIRFADKRDGVASIALEATLPLVHQRFTRTVRLADGANVVLVESELESLLPFDRPVSWAEHATIGSPFLEAETTVVDMSARRAMTRPVDARPSTLPRRLLPGREFAWPNAPGKAGRVNLRAAPRNPRSLDHTTCLMDPERKLAYITALDLRRNLILGYVFHPEEFPWVQNWEFYEGPGKLARGLEFSTQPFGLPRRDAVQMGTLLGAPTFRWLPARSTIATRFLMFWARTPAGMRQVDDVRLEGGVLTVEDRRTLTRVVLRAP